MAGILANSVTGSMVSGDTAVTQTVSGYVSSEQITLSTSPTGSTYAWTLSRPSGTTVRSDLNNEDIAAPKFTPEAEGSYLVTCTVDGSTVYTVQIGVLAASTSNAVQVLRLQPLKNASVATPSDDSVNVYNSYENAALSLKNDAGTVYEIITEQLIRSGSGTPESAVTAPIGTLYLRTDGSTSTTLYVKTSGTGNTGWTAK